MLYKQILFNDDGALHPWAIETWYWGKLIYGLNCDKYLKYNPNLDTRIAIFSHNRLVESIMPSFFSGKTVIWTPENIGDFENFTAVIPTAKIIPYRTDWLPVGATVCWKSRNGIKTGAINAHIPAGMRPIDLFPDRAGYSSATFRFTLDRVTKDHRYVVSLREKQNKTAMYAMNIRDVKPLSEKEYFTLHPGKRFQQPTGE